MEDIVSELHADILHLLDRVRDHNYSKRMTQADGAMISKICQYLLQYSNRAYEMQGALKAANERLAEIEKLNSDLAFQAHLAEESDRRCQQAVDSADAKVAQLRTRIAYLERTDAEQVAEFNAGYEAGERGDPPDEPAGTKHDEWRVGYAFARWPMLLERVAVLEAGQEAQP